MQATFVWFSCMYISVPHKYSSRDWWHSGWPKTNKSNSNCTYLDGLQTILDALLFWLFSQLWWWQDCPQNWPLQYHSERSRSPSFLCCQGLHHRSIPAILLQETHLLLAWFMNNGWLCVAAIPNIKQKNTDGHHPENKLVSSTWVTVQIFHGFGFLPPCVSLFDPPERSCTTTTALSINLISSQPKQNIKRMLLVAHKLSSLRIKVSVG